MGNQKFKTFKCFETKFKTNTTTQGNAFTIDFPGYVEWQAKENGIDQNTLQCCYGHYVTTNQKFN